MNISLIKEKSYHQISGKRGTYIIFMIIVGAISGAIGGLSALIPFTGILSILVLAPFNLSEAIMSMKVSRGEEITTDDCFIGFNSFSRAFVTDLLLGLYIFLWTLLFFIPGIIKSYSYAMTWYILHDDPTLSANEAITKSREMMNGHKMDLFILNLSFIGWHILAILTCGILYFWLAPYISVAHANFYYEVSNYKPSLKEEFGNQELLEEFLKKI